MSAIMNETPVQAVSFRVQGVPRPAGSKTYYGPGRMVDSSGPRGELWRNKIKKSARQAMLVHGLPPQTGPVTLILDFAMPRPKSHFKRAGKGVIRDDPPVWHVQKPDATKLLRAVEDAMTDIVYKDDAQVCDVQVKKRWAIQLTHDTRAEGVFVQVVFGKRQDYEKL